MKSNQLIWAAMVMFFTLGCQKDETVMQVDQGDKSPMQWSFNLKSGGEDLFNSETLDEINSALSEQGVNYRAAMAECIVAAGSNEMKTIVYAKHVGNKQLTADFVPNDIRREWSADPTKITYAIDQTSDAVPSGGLITAEAATDAILNAFGTWNMLPSTDPGLTRNQDWGLDIGFYAWLNGLGGSPYIFADIQIAGWGDIDWASNILGVTVTFIFVDDIEGFPTDIDNNKIADVAFREIYFDPSWYWDDNGMNGIDVESITLHESGHGLSQAHFGVVFVDKDGYVVRVSPRAVMNPYYFGQFRILQNTDIGGHSSIWSNWPMK